MDQLTQQQIDEIQSVLALEDVSKIVKKLSKLQISFLGLLQHIFTHEKAMEIIQAFTEDLTQLKGKTLVAIILFLSTHPNVEYMLKVDALLQSNQFVGTFIREYENQIREGNPISQQIIDHILLNKRNIPNFKLVYKKVFANAKAQNLARLDEFENLIGIERETILIVDKPLIVITPLTPRIKQEYLPKYLQIKKGPNAISKQEELRDMTRRKTMTKKKLMRELYQEQSQLHKIKKDKIQHQLNKTKDGYKKGLRLLEEQQMELKKLKTMQLNIKRHKKKSTRKGGNKQ